MKTAPLVHMRGVHTEVCVGFDCLGGNRIKIQSGSWESGTMVTKRANYIARVDIVPDEPEERRSTTTSPAASPTLSTYSPKTYECPIASACQLDNNGTVYCSIGYTGKLCGVCDEGYMMSGGTCVACAGTFLNPIFLILVGGIVLAASFVLTIKILKACMHVLCD